MNSVNWLAKKHINYEKTVKMLEDCESTNSFTNYGKYTKMLEEYTHTKLKLNGNKKVIVCCSGAGALHALVSGINLFNNAQLKWVTQSFTFPSSAQGILSDAHIVDIDEGGGLDINLVPVDCDGLIVTNIFGNVVDIAKYEKYAKDANKILIFDNAATMYSFYEGSNACNYGTGCIISFHHTKPFGFGEGGAVIVDSEYEESVRRIINFGLDNPKHIPWHRFGSNYKISEIAAIYILQYLIDNFDNIVDHHINLYEWVKKNIQCELYPNFSDGPPVLSCICLLNNKFTPEYVQNMINNNVWCRKYYTPLVDLNVSTKMYDKILCYPCNLNVNKITLPGF